MIPKKKKTFSLFFAAFLNSSWNFERFEKKDEAHSFRIFDVTDSKNIVR